MRTIALAATLWAAVFMTVTTSAQQEKSVNDGVYTTEQAERGAATFKTTCTSCHEPARFTGDEFLSAWTGKPLHELFAQMSATMPEDNPGSLKPEQYADVVAYFLQLNGYPAGKTDLEGTADGLKAIKFDKKAPKR
jgi:mono/diheme cytochrome c family protein